MKYYNDPEGSQDEEIEGAPPAQSRAEMRESRLSETITVNRYLYQQTQQLVYMLLSAPDLQALLEILLVSMPRHFAFRVAELWLYDPEDVLSGLIVGGQRYGQQLQLYRDAFPIQELYDQEPDIVLIDATDSRMFEVLKSAQGIDCALLMPLTDAGRIIGSLHLGLQDDSLIIGESEQNLVAHLAAIISSCFKTGVSRQQVSRLTLLDSLTHISNSLGFAKDIAREIARAQRSEQPVSLLLVEIDGYDDLYEHYGKRRGLFLVKKVVERISSGLRATDMMARLARPRLAVILPGSGEMLAQDIAGRMGVEIENFSIDDGRGAVLQVTVSIGLVTWEPLQYPAVDMAQLGRQMESVADKALATAQSRGGNQVTLSRLSTPIL